jgi:hypothetical protein
MMRAKGISTSWDTADTTADQSPGFTRTSLVTFKSVEFSGDGVTAVLKPGLGSVSVVAGLNIPLAAGETRAVVLSTISDYCQGVVTLTGALGASLQLFNI